MRNSGTQNHALTIGPAAGFLGKSSNALSMSPSRFCDALSMLPRTAEWGPKHLFRLHERRHFIFGARAFVRWVYCEPESILVSPSLLGRKRERV
jgi:hypothetical protein